MQHRDRRFTFKMFDSHLIWLHRGCNGSGGSRSLQTSAASDTGPDTPRLLYSTLWEPPQTDRWLPRSRHCCTTSPLQWRSAVMQEKGRMGQVFMTFGVLKKSSLWFVSVFKYLPLTFLYEQMFIHFYRQQHTTVSKPVASSWKALQAPWCTWGFLQQQRSFAWDEQRERRVNQPQQSPRWIPPVRSFGINLTYDVIIIRSKSPPLKTPKHTGSNAKYIHLH